MTKLLSNKIAKSAEAPFFNESEAFADYTSGLYYYPDLNFNAVSSITFVADYIHFVPFYPKKAHTFTGIAAFNTDASEIAHNSRLGIYDSDGYLPDALVVDAGVISLTAATALREKTISESLTKDLYWLALLCDNDDHFNGADVANMNSPPIINVGVGSIRTRYPLGGMRYSYTYGALPASITQANLLVDDAYDWPMLLMKG